MPNTRLHRGDWKNYLSYSKWMYIVLGISFWMLGDILFSATEYRVPEERQVNIQMVSGYAETEGTLLSIAENALAEGQQYDDTLEEVVFYHIAYDPDDTSDAYGIQKYQLMLGVAEGDVYMLERALMEQLVDEGYCLPLEGYIATGVLDPGDVDLESVTYHEAPDLEDYDPNATHVYAVPMENMNAMLQEGINYDNRDKFMVLMAFSGNPDTSAAVMSSVIAQLTAPRPDWAVIDESATGVNPFDSALQQAGLATAAPGESAAPTAEPAASPTEPAVSPTAEPAASPTEPAASTVPDIK